LATNCRPGSHGDDLVGLELELPGVTHGVLQEHLVHDVEELLDALILAQVFPALHQEVVVTLVVTADCDTLWLT